MDQLADLVAKYGVRRAVLTVIVLLFLQQTVGRRLRDKLINMPPGPVPAPIIGTFYTLSPPNTEPGLHKDLWRLAQQYGMIYTLYFGNNKGVVLNSPELWFEALNTKQDETSQRPQLKSFDAITLGGQGVAMNNGRRWRAIRTILQKSVTNKQLGDASEPMIMEELNATLYWLRKEVEAGRGSTFDLRQLTRRESLNIAMRKIFSFRFSTAMSQDYFETQDWIRVIFEHLAQGSPSDFMPLFKYFPNPEEDNYRKTCLRMHKFLDEEFARHKKEEGLRKGTDMDFMDLMLVEQKASQAEQKKDADVVVMSDVDIKVSAWDMMAGAIDTSATTMEWSVYILVNFKQVQQKLHAILDEVVGPNRLPSLEDVPKLDYVTAVLDEIVRWKHFAPQGLPHEAAVDMTLGGYNVPKGTQIFFNFYSLHHNPKLWKKPEEFRPERFLEEEKELLTTLLHSEMFFKDPKAYKFVPFGQGRRRCVGYGLGRIVLWLKFATWVHCFDWDSVDGNPLNIDTEILGITMMPELQKVKATPRPAARLLKGEDEILKHVESR